VRPHPCVLVGVVACRVRLGHRAVERRAEEVRCLGSGPVTNGDRVLDADEQEVAVTGRLVEQDLGPVRVEHPAVEDQRRVDEVDAHAAQLWHLNAMARSRIEIASLFGNRNIVEPRRRTADLRQPPLHGPRAR